MGADTDSPPPSSGTAARPGRAHRVRRILLGAAASLLALAVLLAAAALFVLGHLEHPWVKPTVVRTLDEALDLELDYRALSFSLASGTLHAEGLEVAQPSRFRGKAAPFLVLREADVSLAVRPLLSGEVRIADATLAGLELTYVADETTDSFTLLFPTDPSEPVAPLSHSLDSLRGLGVDLTKARAPGAAVAYVELEGGRVVRRARLAELALEARFHENAGRLDVGVTLGADEPARGAALRLAQEGRAANADGTIPAREAIRGDGRVAVEGTLAIRESLELRLALRVLESRGLPVPAGDPLATALDLGIAFDARAGTTRVSLRRLGLLGDVLTARLDGTVEDARPSTLARASGGAELRFDTAAWLPSGIDAQGVRGTLVLDEAELSPHGAKGRLDLRASAERASYAEEGQAAGVEGLELSLATQANVPLDAEGSTPGSDPRLVQLRLDVRSRSLRASDATAGTSLEGTGLVASLVGPGLVLAPSGPTSLGGEGSAREPDVLDVAFDGLALAEGTSTSARLAHPRLHAEGAGLVGAMTANTAAEGRVSLEAERLEARSGGDSANLAPVSLSTELHAFLRNPAGLFGLGGRASIRLATTGTVSSAGQVARVSGFAPALEADFDRGTVEGSLPFGALSVRSAGEESLALSRAQLRISTSSPTTLAPPSARGHLLVEGPIGHVRASGNAMALPRVRLELTGEGGAYALSGEATVTDLETSSGRFEGEHRLALSGRADLRRHVYDLEAHLGADSSGDSPRLDASLHGTIEPATGALDHRVSLTAERIAPELARFLPEGTRAELSGVRLETHGKLAGVFTRVPRAGEVPTLADVVLARLRGEEHGSLVVEGLHATREDGTELETPRVSLSLDFVQRDEGAEIELGGEAGEARVKSGNDELVLHGFRPHVEIRMPDAAVPEVASITADVALARVEQAIVPGYPVTNVRLTAAIDSDPSALTIRELVLVNGGGHGSIRMTGAYESDVDGSMTSRAARSEAAIDGRQALSLSGTVEQDLAPLAGGDFARRASGRLRIPFEIQSGDLQSYRALARLVAEAVEFVNPDGSLTVEGLNGEIPIEETLTLIAGGPVLDPGVGVAPMSRARFPDVQPFLNTDAFVTSQRIVWQGSTLGPLAGNVRIAGTTVRIDRLQIGYRGGELTGQLELDLMPGSSHIAFRGNATGIHTEHGGDEVLDANMAIRFVPETLALDGSMHLVRMSREHLRELIDALDPYHENTDLNTVRSVLRLGYPRFARLVASEGLLDFEVALGGLASAIRIDAIRAIPIAPLLDEYAAPLVETLFPRDRPHVAGPEAAAPSESPRGTAP